MHRVCLPAADAECCLRGWWCRRQTEEKTTRRLAQAASAKELSLRMRSQLRAEEQACAAEEDRAVRARLAETHR